MLIDKTQKKLLNSILYFLEETENCNKIKLIKLLYFLDFIHCQDKGRPVTGLSYFVWPMGPVPSSLYDEIEKGNDLFDGAIKVELHEFAPGKTRADFIPNKTSDLKIFTKREQKILHQLVTEYKTTKAADMIEATHLENQPWDLVYNKNKMKQGIIDYELAFRKSEQEIFSKLHEESNEMKDNYS